VVGLLTGRKADSLSNDFHATLRRPLDWIPDKPPTFVRYRTSPELLVITRRFSRLQYAASVLESGAMGIMSLHFVLASVP